MRMPECIWNATIQLKIDPNPILKWKLDLGAFNTTSLEDPKRIVSF